MPYLYENLESELGKRTLAGIQIPDYIQDNLKHNLFDWQEKAMQYLVAYSDPQNDFLTAPTHLLFNMATGSGKTLLMAACLLYYYRRDYRHFVFFVNRNNIIDKTESNFIDSGHNKYLFRQSIVVDGQTVPLRQVEAFSDDPVGIEIKFTTIQKLYNDIHIEKENRTTLDDLHQRDVVMLADEAHHLNTDTSKQQWQLDVKTALRDGSSVGEVEKMGWEHTVIDLILHKNGKAGANKNVLLEFTATVPENEAVQNKYRDKIIYKFGLKDFLRAGYTKEINLISTTLIKKKRVLHALAFNWLRHKVALDNGIANFKPVILFRSKTIAESEKDYQEFMAWVDAIDADDFAFLDDFRNKMAADTGATERGRFSTEKLLAFIARQQNGYADIARFVRNNFTDRSVVITNSKSGTSTKEKTTEAQEKLLNSLEDKSNPIRAIFTVERLTEGWDVLNLFDIVRLYEGQNAGGDTKKTPKATVQEKQLIGRGVRYCPFAHGDRPANKRKFDGDADNDLRILEELFYYTFDEESRYISHLKDELRKDGYIDDGKVQTLFDVTPAFKQSALYQKQKIWYNQRQPNPGQKAQGLLAIRAAFAASPVAYGVPGLEMGEHKKPLDKSNEVVYETAAEKRYNINITLSEIERHIFGKAISIRTKADNSVFWFKNLYKKLPIASVNDLRKEAVLGDVEITITASVAGYDDISNHDKLAMCLKFLDRLSAEIAAKIHPYIGGEFKSGKFAEFFGEPKMKMVAADSVGEVPESWGWYALNKLAGTGEEKALVTFIRERIGNLEKKYTDIYLLRNEEVYKIYDYEQGRGFMPDFLLFLKAKGKKPGGGLYYQIFIEPKQGRVMDSPDEKWKEDFLLAIAEKHGLSPKSILKAENAEYRLIGLPFFNQAQQSANFTPKFDALLDG